MSIIPTTSNLFKVVNASFLQTPQIILLTFDGAINGNNYDHYQKVLADTRKNPNGCPLKGTFFISHEYSDYSMIQNLASKGHEIGVETIS